MRIEVFYRVSYWNRCTPYHTHDTRTLNAINLHNRKVLLWTRLGIQGHFKTHTPTPKIFRYPHGGQKQSCEMKFSWYLNSNVFKKNICQQNILFLLKSFLISWMLSNFHVKIRFPAKDITKNILGQKIDEFFFIFSMPCLPKLPLAEI